MKQYPFSLLIHNIWPPVYVLYIGVITSFSPLFVLMFNSAYTYTYRSIYVQCTCTR